MQIKPTSSSCRPHLLVLWALGCSAGSSDLGTDGTTTDARLGAVGPVFEDLPAGSATIVGFDGQACAGQTAGTEAAASVMQLVVDTSGSMDQDAPGSGSKWVQTRRALLGAVDGMAGDTSVGVIFYPNADGDGDDDVPCFAKQTAVGVGRLDAGQQRQRIRRAFDDQDPEGGTPTHDAYAYAVAELTRVDAFGSRFLVLITDGIPTFSLGCDTSGRQGDDNAVDAAPLVGEAARALAGGVRTFVVGSPGSEQARGSLSRMAEAGGTARADCSHSGPNYCHFDMTREADLGAGLENTLRTISGLALSCSYRIPEPPAGSVLDPAKVNLVFTPRGGQLELIAQSPDGSCSEGWQYSRDQAQVQLCGGTCERVRSSQGTLDMQFGCKTQVR